MDKQYDKIIRRTQGSAQGRPKSGNALRFTQNNTKNISNDIKGNDGILGFWVKKFPSIHNRKALEVNRCLQGVYVPEWMTKGKTTLIQKDPSREQPETTTDP